MAKSRGPLRDCAGDGSHNNNISFRNVNDDFQRTIVIIKTVFSVVSTGGVTSSRPRNSYDRNERTNNITVEGVTEFPTGDRRVRSEIWDRFHRAKIPILANFPKGISEDFIIISTGHYYYNALGPFSIAQSRASDSALRDPWIHDKTEITNRVRNVHIGFATDVTSLFEN